MIDMQQRAKEIVVHYVNEHLDYTDAAECTLDNVYVVWFSKTLQNWKALLSTTFLDGMYYEVTHNGSMGETYLDAYKKFQNISIIDGKDGTK